MGDQEGPWLGEVTSVALWRSASLWSLQVGESQRHNLWKRGPAFMRPYPQKNSNKIKSKVVEILHTGITDLLVLKLELEIVIMRCAWLPPIIS